MGLFTQPRVSWVRPVRATIGAAIRKEKQLSQSELGKRAGISGDIVGKYERDEMKPSIETATKLAAALEVSLDYLVGIAQM